MLWQKAQECLSGGFSILFLAEKASPRAVKWYKYLVKSGLQTRTQQAQAWPKMLLVYTNLKPESCEKQAQLLVVSCCGLRQISPNWSLIIWPERPRRQSTLGSREGHLSSIARDITLTHRQCSAIRGHRGSGNLIITSAHQKREIAIGWFRRLQKSILPCAETTGLQGRTLQLRVGCLVPCRSSSAYYCTDYLVGVGGSVVSIHFSFCRSLPLVSHSVHSLRF